MITYRGRGIVFGLILAAPVVLAQTAGQAPANAAPSAAASTPSHKAHKPTPAHKPAPPPPLVLPPLPSGPLSQMPLDKIPSTPAKVSFQDGMLTISAQNSTLGEILRDVRKLTGASVEFPPGSNGANERVVTHLGPGAPRDVLVGLLNGTSFNYVMLGSNSDPAAVSSVILTPKEAVAGQTQTAANVQNSFQPPHPFNPQAVVPMPGNGVAESSDSDDSNATEEQEAEEATTDDQSQPAQGVQQPDQAAAPGQPGTDPNQPNAGPKTPEQILDMLRRQQQPGAAVPQPPQQPPQSEQ